MICGLPSRGNLHCMPVSRRNKWCELEISECFTAGPPHL